MSEDTYGYEDAALGGPGLDGYAYCADVYCVDCGLDIALDRSMKIGRRWTSAEFSDSEHVPQPIFFGESDRAEHCAGCGDFLYGGCPHREGDNGNCVDCGEAL